jgi:hypothetical protein
VLLLRGDVAILQVQLLDGFAPNLSSLFSNDFYFAGIVISMREIFRFG